MGRMRDQDERFWEKVNKTSGCWLWTGAITLGYGVFRTRNPRDTVRAHRYAYERLVGPVPDGLDLDHLCRHRDCVNPAHLEPVTRRVNVLRGENLAAKRARQIVCKRGHSNWHIDKHGWRKCRDCDAALHRARKAAA